MTRSTRTYVEDILAEMDRIERFVGEMSPSDLQASDLVSYAVIRAFEVIGEAAKHVPDDVRARCPEVMWREMAGMRDRLAHAYWGTEMSFAWVTIYERFPIERAALRRLLDDLSRDRPAG
ncbi:DUF86 domain-containing protein [Rubrivirga sp. S365]|uniref:HepT-like ribonuclease domain-containing protein n=1 Tax=Rubrivirga sp. S365 TaxID=3076080 RepID=UPI0028C956C9|nr:DUF86 domain-containing protein [Rubrivirga sp. S365]MDT7855636.1 DUF86 domain-containing protein [Rubrivirga sp. S365]